MDDFPPPLTRQACRELDDRDPLRGKRDEFQMPEGTIYLDGNSLGPLPKSVMECVTRVVQEEWGRGLISSWNDAGWLAAPQRIGARLAPLIGAAASEVVVADSVSVNLFKLLSAACRMQSGDCELLVEKDGFPTDLYIAQSVGRLFPNVRVAPVARCELLERIEAGVGLVCVSHVDYRTGDLFDLVEISERAQAIGALTIVDLSHSAGALKVDLSEAEIDFAVGCGYKYLNGGPGAPSFVFVATRHHSSLDQPLTGWLGHARPFDFADEFQSSDDIRQLQCGTPPILSLASFEAALEVWTDVDLDVVRLKSQRLGETMRVLIENRNECRQLKLVSPSDPNKRGSQLSYAHEQGYAVMQALIAAGVIGDFRQPDLLRFGLCPLYLGFCDIYDAVEKLGEILASGAWDQPEFHRRKEVT